MLSIGDNIHIVYMDLHHVVNHFHVLQSGFQIIRDERLKNGTQDVYDKNYEYYHGIMAMPDASFCIQNIHGTGIQRKHDSYARKKNVGKKAGNMVLKQSHAVLGVVSNVSYTR